MINQSEIVEKFFTPGKSQKYRYWLVGDIKNSPIILLSGYANIGYEDFIQIAENLHNKYFLIIPEYPGWGESSKLEASLTITNYATYLNDLSNYLNLKNVILLGHCFGAAIAIEISYKYPQLVSELILINPFYLDGTIAKEAYLILVKTSLLFPKSVRPLFYFWRSRILNIPLDYFVVKTKSLKIKLHRIRNRIMYQSLHNEQTVEENWSSLIRFNFGKVKKINTRAHIVHGEKDLLISLNQAKKFYKLFNNATFNIIQNAGHIPFIENPQELIKTISKYL